MADITIRNARPEDAPFLAKCIMAGMHFYDFESDIPSERNIYDNPIECEQRDNMLYSYRYTRVAEMDGTSVGSLLSYPGEIYRDLRHKTFCELWPNRSPNPPAISRVPAPSYSKARKRNTPATRGSSYTFGPMGATNVTVR